LPNYAYEAVNPLGKRVKGISRAPNKHTVISELQVKGLLVRSVQEKKPGLLDKEIIIGRQIKLEHFVIFCRQFSTMIRSGLTIDAVLKILEEQTRSKRLKAALTDLMEQVRNGHALSESMRRHPRLFPDLFVNMIYSGEAGGALDEVLERMADHYEKEHKTIQKVKSALTYPIIVILIAIAVVIFLMLNVVPIFVAMFEEQQLKLPLVTRIVAGTSTWLSSYWWVLGLLIIGSVPFIRVGLTQDTIRKHIDRFILRIPIFGTLLMKESVARMARTLSACFQSAVPVLEALQVTSSVMGNRALSEVLVQSKESLQEGQPLSQPMARSRLFPTMVIQMLAVGEETGELDTMLTKLADHYEADVEHTVDRLKSTLEPLLLLFISLLVGIIVAAVMTPMFQIYETYLQ
jgi:type IV pilus assembly protein PilC